MSGKSVPSRRPTEKSSNASLSALRGIKILYDDGAGSPAEASGEQLARLLAFARASSPSWGRWLEDGLETVPDEMEGLASLIHHAEETPNVLEPKVLHFIHEAMESMAARLRAAQVDAEQVAGECRVQLRADAAAEGRARGGPAGMGA